MYIKRNIDWRIILGFAWKNLLFFVIYGFAIVFAFHFFEHNNTNISIPFLPVSTIGIAVAFYIGFKNNQSYDRFWEGRKIWGGIVNFSRIWGNQVLSFVNEDHAIKPTSDEAIKKIQKSMIYTHLAYINALRLQLREPTSFSIDYTKNKGSAVHYKGRPGGEDWIRDVGSFLKGREDLKYLKEVKNTATQIIRHQGETLKNLKQEGLIEDFRHMELMNSLNTFYELQGKAERIKKTPLPRQYAFFSKIFTWIFILMMPFGLVGEFAKMGHNEVWITIPCFIIIAWIFITMEVVGDNSEDPFENFINDVPMTALCRTIEIDLREMLGESDIPPGISAENGVLM